MATKPKLVLCVFSAALLLAAGVARADVIITTPYRGITYIVRSETSPRKEIVHIVEVDLSAPGIRFELTPAGGDRETVRQTTLDYLNQVHAQIAVNAHFFVPFPSTDTTANVVGLAASNGNMYSPFERQPVAEGFPDQSYAIIPFAPAVNIDADNHACMVHRDSNYSDNKHVLETVSLYNALAGSAQIITHGVVTIPVYKDAGHPDGQLTADDTYSNSNSWYSQLKARTVMGLVKDEKRLIIFTVDKAGGSEGMMVGEVAELLIRDYGVYSAINLDGGGSTTLVMADPATHAGRIMNVSSDNPLGRSVGSSLAIFAARVPKHRNSSYFIAIAVVSGGAIALLIKRRTRRLHSSNPEA